MDAVEERKTSMSGLKNLKNNLFTLSEEEFNEAMERLRLLRELF